MVKGDINQEELIHRRTARLIEIARGITDGSVGIIEGSRKISSMRHELSDPDDVIFNIFIGIDSETDHLPVGDERRHWSKDALAAKDTEILKYEDSQRSDAQAACKRLIERFESSG